MQVQREIKIHSQLQHQNIVKLFAAFEDCEHVYLVLEYAAGTTLQQATWMLYSALQNQQVAVDEAPIYAHQS